MFTGVVDAAGNLTVKFGPNPAVNWNITQMSIEMPSAPTGAGASAYARGGLLFPFPTPRRAAAAGDPPVFLFGGERAEVRWSACTPGDVGTVFVLYDKMPVR